MKKRLVLMMALSMALAVPGCAMAEESTEAATETVSEAAETETEEATEVETDVKGEGVMTHEEYLAADVDAEVVIETYVQAKQSWWEDKATIYTQDKDGAYFIYNMPCSEEEYEKLVPGTKIKVTGYKAEWSGEIEVADVESFEIEDGEYIAKPLDVTDLLGKDELIDHQNELVSFKGMTVEAAARMQTETTFRSCTTTTVPEARETICTSTFPTMARPTPLPLSPISAIKILTYTKQ